MKAIQWAVGVAVLALVACGGTVSDTDTKGDKRSGVEGGGGAPAPGGPQAGNGGGAMGDQGGQPQQPKACEGNKAEADCAADKAGCSWIPEKTVKNENGGTSTQAARCVKPEVKPAPQPPRACEGNKAEAECSADKEGCKWIPEKTVPGENGGTATQAARCVKPG